MGDYSRLKETIKLLNMQMQQMNLKSWLRGEKGILGAVGKTGWLRPPGGGCLAGDSEGEGEEESDTGVSQAGEVARAKWLRRTQAWCALQPKGQCVRCR